MQLAGEVLSYLNSTITTQGSKKLGIQFGAYATFLSFFGLADLPKTTVDFTGIVDYASSMAFELFTTADTSSSFPATSDLQVRFLFHNGTATNSSQPTVYPLFGGDKTALSWDDFQSGLKKFAIMNTEQWCGKCGNSTGACAAYAKNGASSNGGQGQAQKSSDGGMSPAIGGVIGAFVTLAVVLGALALGMTAGGLRLVSKKSLVRGQGGVAEVKA